MNKKILISERERLQIGSLYNLINEDNTLASIFGFVKYQTLFIADSTVKLYKDGNIVKGAKTDENGRFEIPDVPIGKYVLKISVSGGEYQDDLTDGREINILTNTPHDAGILNFTKVQTFGEIKIPIKFYVTSLSVQVNDEFDNPLPNATITINYKRSDIEFGNNVTDNNGMLSNIILDKTKYPVFDSEVSGDTLNITVGVKYFNIKQNVEKTIYLNNSRFSKGNADNPSPEKKITIRKGSENVVNFKIRTTMPFKVSVIDETDNPLMTSDIKVYGDDETTPLISGKGVVTSKVKDIDKIVVQVTNQGYISVKRRYNLNFNGENEIEVKLKKIKPPKPPKDINKRQCIRLTRDFYNDMRRVHDGSKTINGLGGESSINERRKDVESCFLTYKDKYPRMANQMVKRLVHVGSNLKIFGLKFTLAQNKDIYKENKIMSVSNTIRKVVSEHIEKKQIISEEKKLINKRYKFSLVGINKNKKRIVESTLREERRMLLRAGYNKTIVNETFLDVMNGLYGAEGNNVLKDIKTRLGQKIADQVKNKEDEHNMILTAFEELPEDVIERAIKENRVDELSAMIATKAMEGYKASFGTEGISGLMFASVDENKFKQEVAKLIEPAIKDITTKMDDKFKQVQDVVSGMGVNPTA
jgi:hypothetical protein